MLESLTIRNYAIIDELTADFTGGLNIITGETGAGKSIVVDALELVLGARASAEMIRAGADFLEVSGVFILDKSLIEEALPGDVDNDILIQSYRIVVISIFYSGYHYVAATENNDITIYCLRTV